VGSIIAETATQATEKRTRPGKRKRKISLVSAPHTVDGFNSRKTINLV